MLHRVPFTSASFWYPLVCVFFGGGCSYVFRCARLFVVEKYEKKNIIFFWLFFNYKRKTPLALLLSLAALQELTLLADPRSLVALRRALWGTQGDVAAGGGGLWIWEFWESG